MKIQKIYALVFAVVLCTMTSCFRPDGTAAEEDANMLVGYWELVHAAEESLWRDVNEDGTLGEAELYSDSYDITCNDGNKEWCIMRFTESVMSFVATDDPDMALILDLPIPYSFDGKKLVSPLMGLDSSEGFASVEFINDDCMEFYILDEGDVYDEETGGYEGYEKCQSWKTYRRVTDEN